MAVMEITYDVAYKGNAFTRWYDADNSHYAGFKANATTTANVDYTWPAAPPAVSGYVMSSTTAGVMSWAAVLSLTAQVKNTALLGPITGANAIPTFRAFDRLDLPIGLDMEPVAGDIIYSEVGDTWDNLGIGPTGSYLRSNGTVPSWQSVQASEVVSGGNLATGTGLTISAGSGTAALLQSATVALSAGSIASLALADTSVQPSRQIISGGGLTGGGNLSADRTLAVGAGTGITVSADAISITDTAVVPDSYGSASQSAVITMDQQGRITAAADVSIAIDAAAIITGTIATARLGSGTANSSTFLRGDGTWATPAGGSGTVTSVALTAPSFISVAGSPITTSGTLALTLANQSANRFFAGPSGGGATTPAFRLMEQSDLAAGLDVVPGTGDMLYSPVGDTWDKLVAGANGKVLTMVAGVPAWATASPGSGAPRIYSKVAETTIANTTTTTTFTDAGVGSLTISGNTFAVGAQVRIRCGGYYTTKTLTPGTFSIQFFFGATATESILLSGLPANVSSTVGVWQAEFNWSVMTIGASGTIAGQGSFTYSSPGITDTILGNGAKRSSTACDTTADQTFDIKGTWQTADALNSITCEYATIELLNN